MPPVGVAGTLQPNGWLPVNPDTGEQIPWAEAIAGGGPLSDGQLAYEGGSHFVVPLWFYWTDLAKAIPAILGTNTFDGANLNRVLPLQHPLFPKLYATKITSIKSRQFTGKTRKQSLNTAGSPVAGANLVLLTVMFANELGIVMDDVTLDSEFPPVAGIRQEWQRYTIKDIEPASEVISREGGSFTFVNGPANVINKQFAQTAGQTLLKPTLIWKWKRVPQVGLFSDDGTGPPAMFGGNFFPLGNLVGCVNDGIFPPGMAGGYSPGTLLFLPPKFHREDNPLPKDTPVGSILGTIQDYYTVEIPFSVFSPPVGPADGLTYFGHNLFPAPQNMLWYLAKDTATKTSTLFPYDNFARIFQLVN